MNRLWIIIGFGFVAYFCIRYYQNRRKKKLKVMVCEPPTQQKINPIDQTIQFLNARIEKADCIRAEAEIWAKRWGDARMPVIDAMSGTEFEDYLDGLFTAMGYLVKQTPATGDFGGDLILTRNERRIVVQAKRWQGTVGVDAVQEALSGKSFYGCQDAWVVTNSTFTIKASELAFKTGVSLIDRKGLSKMIGDLQGKVKHD